jgi:hypothetical protein
VYVQRTIKWPLIAEGVACRIIAAPDTNAFQERVFSEVKTFFRPRRNHLEMSKFEVQVLLSSNSGQVQSLEDQAIDTAMAAQT